MALTYRDGVAVAELICYCPSAIIGIYLTLINEFHTTGWIDIFLFSAIRIVGSAIQVEAKNHPGTTKLYTVASIMNSIGLAPLQAGSLGFLNRLSENIGGKTQSQAQKYMFRIIQMLIITGLILGVVGGIKAGNQIKNTGTFAIGSIGKIGTGFLIGAYAATLVVAASLHRVVSFADRKYRRLFWAVIAAAFPLAVRLVYAILATLTDEKKFNFITGNVTAWLCLAVIPEFLVILIYIILGVSLGRQRKTSKEGDYEVTSLDGHQLNIARQSKRQSNTSSHNQNPVVRTTIKIFNMTIIGRITRSIRERGRN
ncbi:hypothetical protein TrVGV298_009633 [Trichoderma virens]|nr:hypothetical protein TrVGV298_009633 [Trichoderma virens]